jgi:RHS repeat-associated protein
LLCPSFGSLISNRSWSDASRTYRYGFNGKEKDFETASDNYDFGARIYDARLGRWLSLDPLMSYYAEISPFAYANCNPIFFIDPDGMRVIPKSSFKKSAYYKFYKSLIKNNSVYKNLLSKYIGSENFNLYLEQKDENVPNNSFATTRFGIGDRCGIESNGKKTYTIVKGTTYFSECMLYEAEEIKEGDKTYIITKTQTDIKIVQTLLHEALHAKLGAIFNGEPLNDDNHDAYSKQQSYILNGLIEYNLDNKLGYTLEQLTQLSWQGMSNSVGFKKYLDELALKNGTTYDEEYAKWYNAVQEMSYKVVDKKEIVKDEKEEPTESNDK